MNTPQAMLYTRLQAKLKEIKKQMQNLSEKGLS